MKFRRFLSIFLASSLLLANVPELAFGETLGIAGVIEEEITSESALGVSSSRADYSFEVTSQWGTGFNGEITLFNSGDKPVENWEISFDFPHEIENIWNAKIVDKNNKNYIIKNIGWNSDIGAASSVSFGFTASYSGEITEPSDFRLIEKQLKEEELYSVEYSLNSDWNNGFSAQLSVTNNSDKAVEGWSLDFDFDRTIASIWNATVEKNEGSHYTLKNAGYNSIINPGETIIIGFNGTGGSAEDEPDNCVLSSLSAGEGSSEIIDKPEEEEEPDIDKDGLQNDFENQIGTDCENPDSDGDGLSDYDEVIYGLTNPLLADSDENGVMDCDEDHDGDGLSFIEELGYGSKPTAEDSDNDTLNDYSEVYEYLTSPELADTDMDSLNDDDEILLGLNPNLTDTDMDGICDSEEKILQSKSYEIRCEEKPEIIGVDIEISMCGSIEKNLRVTNLLGVDSYNSSLVGLVGAPLDISCYSDFDSATVTYIYDKSLVSDEVAQNLGVLSFDSETFEYEIKEAKVDIEKGTISFTTNHFCALPLCDLSEYKTAISDIPDYLGEDKAGNEEWNGEVITVEKASELFNISQSDITAMADNNSLYVLKGKGVYNLNNGEVLIIPHKYFSRKIMEKTALYRSGNDASRGILAPKNWEMTYTNYISSDYDFGETNDGKPGFLPYYDDIDKSNPGYIAIESKYFIPSTVLDTTDTDGDGLYDVYEIQGMRMNNGDLMYTDYKNPDTDGDGLEDGKEAFVSKSSFKGLFRMRCNPTIYDTDSDGLSDKEDTYPGFYNYNYANNEDNIEYRYIYFGGSLISTVNSSNNSNIYYLTAMFDNNTEKKIENYDFDAIIENKADGNPSVLIVEEASTATKHILPNEYAEKTWKIVTGKDIKSTDLKIKIKFESTTAPFLQFFKDINSYEIYSIEEILQFSDEEFEEVLNDEAVRLEYVKQWIDRSNRTSIREEEVNPYCDCSWINDFSNSQKKRLIWLLSSPSPDNLSSGVGSALKYTLELSGDVGTGEYNCYSYALNERINNSTVGGVSNYRLKGFYDDTVLTYVIGVLTDVNKYCIDNRTDYSIRIIESFDSPIADNEYRIAMRYRVDNNNSFHFMRQDSDGGWSEKNGEEPSFKHYSDITPETPYTNGTQVLGALDLNEKYKEYVRQIWSDKKLVLFSDEAYNNLDTDYLNYQEMRIYKSDIVYFAVYIK